MIRRLLAVVLTGLIFLVVSAGPASAIGLGDLPGLGSLDCKTSPTPNLPGMGMPAVFDGHQAGTGSSTYATHGYAGLSWSTYDLGCLVPGAVADTGATIDTFLGNMALGTAVTLVGLADGLHNFAAGPSFASALDPIAISLTQGVSGAVYTPWIGVSLAVLALVLLVGAHRGNLSGVVSSVGWALLVMAVAAGVLSYPLAASHAAQAVITGTVGQVNQTMLGEAPHATADPTAARAELIVDTVLYPQWVRGELGRPDSAVAQKYGRRLYDDQAYSWADVPPSKAATTARADDFKATAAQVEKQDPAAYQYLTGHARGRTGPGLMALAGVLLTILFPIVADLLVLGALDIIALVCILFPALAVIGLHPRTSGVIKGILNAAGAALINSVVFSIGAAIAYRAAGVLLNTPAIPQWLGLLACGVVCVVLWAVLKPFRRLTAMVGAGYSPARNIADQTQAHRASVWGMAKRIGATAGGAKIGSEAGTKEALQEDRQHQRVEEWSRPEPDQAVLPNLVYATAAPAPAAPSARPHGAAPRRVAVDLGTSMLRSLTAERPAAPPTIAVPNPPVSPPVSPPVDLTDPAVTHTETDHDGRTKWTIYNPATQRMETINRAT